MNKQRKIIILLSCFLFLTFQYILINEWMDLNQQKNFESFQSGYENGLFDAVSTIYTQTDDCQTSIITVGNFSKQIVDVLCLDQIIKNNP